MGNPRQKKKLRSSFPKAIQKPKKTNAKILGNAVIAANWDHKQTLTQNYRRLGIAHRLKRPAGGTEDKIKSGAHVGDKRVSSRQRTEDTQEVRIRRDKEGNVIVDDGTTGLGKSEKMKGDIKKKKKSPWGSLDDPIDSDDNEDDEQDEDNSDAEGDKNATINPIHNPHASTGHLGSQWSNPNSNSLSNTTSTTNTNVSMNATNNPVSPHILHQLAQSALVASADRTANKPKRTPSAREQAWIEALITKHGEDYEGMARDAKLNIRQQSVGDIKRRVRGWVALGKA